MATDPIRLIRGHERCNVCVCVFMNGYHSLDNAPMVALSCELAKLARIKRHARFASFHVALASTTL